MTYQPDLFKSSDAPAEPILYFAFGSNLQIEQMKRRCPSAEVEGVGRLYGYRLAFAGFSVTRGGAGVATVIEDETAWTSGAVFSIDQADLNRLDRFEGHPVSYRRSLHPIRLDDGRIVWSHVYIKRDIENLPTEDYAMEVLNGYRQHGLDFEPLLNALESAKESRYPYAN